MPGIKKFLVFRKIQSFVNKKFMKMTTSLIFMSTPKCSHEYIKRDLTEDSYQWQRISPLQKMFVCMPDVLAWNLGFLLVNFVHVMYLGYQMCPTRLEHLTKQLNEKLFKPLNVDRKLFKALTNIGDTYLLTKEGTHYATEGRSKCGKNE